MTVTDPKAAWKKYTLDVLGNLTQVTEDGPGFYYDTFLRPARIARLRTVW